jgi:hypothetical protein
VEDFALTPAERALFRALAHRGVPFMLVGMGAALLGGAPVATQDLDVWFEQLADERIREAAAAAGGFWISGFGMQPPSFGGSGLDRVDIVLTVHGLETFAREYARTIEVTVDDVILRVLPLDRIVASKRATNRLKDQAALPILEATLLAKAQIQPPPFLYHVTEGSRWESIQANGLWPKRDLHPNATGGNVDWVSAFEIVQQVPNDRVSLRAAAAVLKNSARVHSPPLTLNDMIVVEVDTTKAPGMNWRRFSGEQGELRGYVGDSLLARLAYWKTRERVPIHCLRRMSDDD